MKHHISSFVRNLVRRHMPELMIDKTHLGYVLTRRAVESSADFIEQNLLSAQFCSSRLALYPYAMQRASRDGLILECGVNTGVSINALAELTDRQIYGFDSFEGLPDDGTIMSQDSGAKWFVGKMDLKGQLPAVKANVRLVKGWFDKTLPDFLSGQTSSISVLHIDCDIYSSTVTVLESSRRHMVPGTVIIFDDYLNYHGWQGNEHKAFLEFTSKYNVSFGYLAYSLAGSLAIVVTSIAA